MSDTILFDVIGVGLERARSRGRLFRSRPSGQPSLSSLRASAILISLLALCIDGSARTISDRPLFVKGKLFSDACAAAVRVRGRLLVTQRWRVESAICPADVWFSRSGSITYTGAVVFSGTVDGTPDTHFARSSNGTLIFGKDSKPLLSSWWGLKGDGTDQTSAFQDILDSLNSSGGGNISISHAPGCYAVRRLKYFSNITLSSDSRSTCVKKLGGDQGGSPVGGGAVFYSDFMTPITGVHFRNFTIDGNRSDIQGVSGDGGHYGIAFFGASNSSVEHMTIRDAYTDGISIDGAGPTRSALGSGLTIIDSLVTHSRRNNISLLAGLDTTIRDCELSYASGTNPEAGIDVEQYQAGAYVSGFRIIGGEIHHNAAEGILFNLTHQVDTTLEIAVVNVRSHDNGTIGLNAVNFTQFGKLVISGGTYSDNGGCCAINLAGWTQATIEGESVYGSARGILLSSGNPAVLLGAGTVSGTLYDLSVDGPNSMAILDGVHLVHGVIQPGEEDRVTRIR